MCWCVSHTDETCARTRPSAVPARPHVESDIVCALAGHAPALLVSFLRSGTNTPTPARWGAAALPEGDDGRAIVDGVKQMAGSDNEWLAGRSGWLRLSLASPWQGTNLRLRDCCTARALAIAFAQKTGAPIERQLQASYVHDRAWIATNMMR